ncbi:MAG: XdhC family protein [Pseudomonadota bacterium]|nr:XdhC family protein [Pseudomonadota bacterium]
MKALVETLADVLRQGQKAVLCGIVDDSGSSPRSSGARMLVLADGTFTGSIGGGAVEGACLNEAAALLHAPEKYRILSFELTAAQSAESGMVCGGEVTILLQRFTPADLPFFEDALNHRDHPMLLTVIPAGAAPFLALWTAADATAATLPAALRTQLARKAAARRPFRLETEGTRVLAEPLSAPVTVHVAGAGHVGRAIAHLAHFTGFDVVVLDDRPEFASAGRFPQAREVRVVENFQDCLGSLDAGDYVVIVTRGHLHDRHVLAQALRTRAGYVGMIGSRSKREAVYASLLEEGFTQADLDRVHSPIGLDIGAETPEEIGVSVVAELVAVRASRA